MATSSPVRIVLMFVGFFTMLVSITLNTLSSEFAADSVGIFKHSTEYVILMYTTPLTPAQWSLFVWDLSYVWLFAMFIYFLAGLCQRNAYDWMYTTPAALPYGFYVSIIMNRCFNIAWLFLIDRELMLPMLIISALMMITNHMVLFFFCRGMKVYGAWLHKHHNIDLWILRILVQNGLAVYSTWGSLSTLLHLTMYLQHQTDALRCDCAMIALLLLLMQLSAWFLLENFYLDEHVRYIVTTYPVVILYMTGILTNAYSPESPAYLFVALILALSCAMFVARITLVIWRHRKKPFYNDSEPSLSPVEIALTQRSFFL